MSGESTWLQDQFELTSLRADNTQLRKEVERLDKELHEQIQYKLEACRMAEEFKSENARLSQRNGVLENAQTACLGERDTAIGELAKAHADAAVMRGELEDERDEIIRGGRHHVEERRMGVISQALSTNAGRDLLNKLKNLEQLNVDACSDDTAIRDLCRPVLGPKLCDGDSNGVPTLVDVVESLLARYQEAVELVSAWGSCGIGEWCKRRDSVIKDFTGAGLTSLRASPALGLANSPFKQEDASPRISQD